LNRTRLVIPLPHLPSTGAVYTSYLSCFLMLADSPFPYHTFWVVYSLLTHAGITTFVFFV
jgi:hypothetical protein